MSDRLQAETAELSLLYPYQWAGMNSDQRLAIADTPPELLGKLGAGDDQRRTVALLYLDPNRPETPLRSPVTTAVSER